MTRIVAPITRETAVTYRNNPLVIEIGPRTITLREKGTRSDSAYVLSIERLFRIGAEDRAEQDRRDRAKGMRKRPGGALGQTAR